VLILGTGGMFASGHEGPWIGRLRGLPGAAAHTPKKRDRRLARRSLRGRMRMDYRLDQ